MRFMILCEAHTFLQVLVEFRLGIQAPFSEINRPALLQRFASQGCMRAQASCSTAMAAGAMATQAVLHFATGGNDCGVARALAVVCRCAAYLDPVQRVKCILDGIAAIPAPAPCTSPGEAEGFMAKVKSAGAA